jgi:ribosomal protein S27E
LIKIELGKRENLQGHKHNYVWRRKFIELGGNGERVTDASDALIDVEAYSNSKLKKQSKYTLTCPECGYETEAHRKSKRNISCGEHGDRYYNSNRKLIVTQNY